MLLLEFFSFSPGNCKKNLNLSVWFVPWLYLRYFLIGSHLNWTSLLEVHSVIRNLLHLWILRPFLCSMFDLVDCLFFSSLSRLSLPAMSECCWIRKYLCFLYSFYLLCGVCLAKTLWFYNYGDGVEKPWVCPWIIDPQKKARFTPGLLLQEMVKEYFWRMLFSSYFINFLFQFVHGVCFPFFRIFWVKL